MTENKDEEGLEDLTSIQSENTSVEVPKAPTAQTITTNQDTDNMEVHHHAHHEGKKKLENCPCQ